MEASTMICSDEIDRISSLPIDILDKILSNLGIFDVIRMTVLSKRWKYICTTTPYFHFDSYKFDWSRCSNLEEFKEFIYTLLISENTINLVRYNLSCGSMFEETEILPLIHATTRRNVQQLVLWFVLPDGVPFQLPYCLVTCESLQVLQLNLSGHLLRLPNNLGGFRQLKFLHLESVQLSDEHLTSCFFSKCELLEKLILSNCLLDHVDLLSIASASLLYLTLSGSYFCCDCEIKISCPSLKSLEYISPMPKDIVLENLFSIEYVHVYFIDFQDSFEIRGILVHKMIKEVPSISVLKLCKLSLKGLYEAGLSPISLYRLKSLKLKLGGDEDYMQVMIRLLKYSPNLEVLKLWCDEEREDQGQGHEVFPVDKKLHHTYKMHNPEETIVCLDSHLKSIQLIGFKGEENEIELLRFFLKNARVLEKLAIVWAGYAPKSEEASKEVLNIPTTSSQVLLTFHDTKPKRGSGNWYWWQM